METIKKVKVLNRSQSTVIYRIPERNIRREFSPNEMKMLDVAELEALTFQPGGRTLIEDYLLIDNEEVLDDFGINREPEYKLTKLEIEELMKNGSLDSFIDCLNFAPDGVKDTIKALAVSMPLSDSNKRQEIKKILKFDVDLAIKHNLESAEIDVPTEKKERLIKSTEPTTPVRKTAPEYKVVTPK